MTKVSINKQARLSQHFTLGELCKRISADSDVILSLACTWQGIGFVMSKYAITIG